MASPHQISDRLVDPTLKASPRLFATVCIPIRVGLALLLMVGWPYLTKTRIQLIASLLALTAMGLGHKWSVNARSWKNYARPVMLYPLVSGMLFWSAATFDSDPIVQQRVGVCGVLLLVDVLMGQQSQYIAKTYFGSQ